MSIPAKSLKEKVQNLPLLCVEAICKFTPTSKLIRVYSAEVPLPGACWQSALEAALKKRLPLSLDDDLYNQANDSAVALFDKVGAKLAVVKQLDAFRFSPLREFVQSAALPIHFASDRAYPSDVRLITLKFLALLASLPNVRHLRIVVRKGDAESRFESGNHATANLQHLLTQLESLVIKIADGDSAWTDRYPVDALVAELRRALLPLGEMTSLRRLALPEDAFRSVADDQRVLAGLVSLGVSAGGASLSLTTSVPRMLRFLPTCCRQLSCLSVVVRGDFKAYAIAFRAFASLRTLVLDFESTPVGLTGLAFGGGERILSVSDLRIVCLPCPGDGIFAIGWLFPNVRTLVLHAIRSYQAPLDLALAFCERNVFPALEKLSYFSVEPCWHTIDRFVQVVAASSRLPETVDLSQILLGNLTHDVGLLMAVFRAMQCGSVKFLLFRGPVHPDALPRLQSYVDWTCENVEVHAWKDRDLGDQPGLSDFRQIEKYTDFRIVGTKTSGNLKGQQCTIRVFHQLAKRVSIFD